MKMMVEYLLRRNGSVDGALQMVDSAITFAAKQHPREFLKVRSQIKKKLNNALLFVGSDGSSNGDDSMTEAADSLDISMADAPTTCESCNMAADKNDEVSSFRIRQDENTVVESNGDVKKKGPLVIRFKVPAAMKKEQLVSHNNEVSSWMIQQDRNAAVQANGDGKKKGPLVVRFKVPAAMKKEQLVSHNNGVSSWTIQQDKNAAVQPNGDGKKKGPLVVTFKVPAAMKKEQLVFQNNKVSSWTIQQDKNGAVEPNGDDKKKGPLLCLLPRNQGDADAVWREVADCEADSKQKRQRRKRSQRRTIAKYS